MTRNGPLLEAAFERIVEMYPEHFTDQVATIGSLSMVKRSMHILIRREQEGDRSVSEVLDGFEILCRGFNA